MTDLDLTGLVGLGSLILVLTGLVRDVQGKQFKSALTTVLAMAIGIFALVLYAASDFGDTVVISGMKLTDMGFWSIVLVGIQASAFASTGWTIIKALDNTQSAAKPSLAGGDKPQA